MDVSLLYQCFSPFLSLSKSNKKMSSGEDLKKKRKTLRHLQPLIEYRMRIWGQVISILFLVPFLKFQEFTIDTSVIW